MYMANKYVKQIQCLKRKMYANDMTIIDPHIRNPT